MSGLEIIIWTLSLSGILISFLTFSGTWLIFIAALIATIQNALQIETCIIFLLTCITIEIIELFASKWGIEKRGGSKQASWAAVIGAIIGTMFLPIIGTFIGSFAFAFAVEYLRLKKIDRATHIAVGSVIAKLICTTIKIGASIIMAIILISKTKT